jgi:hypothetical protein
MASIDASISLCSFDTKYLMRKLATLTKMTAKGLSTWTFAQCDGIYVAFGGTTNRCKVLRSYQQLQDLMCMFVSYGYKRPHSVTPKPIKRVPPSMQQELALLETMTQETAPRPAEDALVALY